MYGVLWCMVYCAICVVVCCVWCVVVYGVFWYVCCVVLRCMGKFFSFLPQAFGDGFFPDLIEEAFILETVDSG